MYYERAITRLSYFFILPVYYFVFTLYHGIIYSEYRCIYPAALDWHSTDMVTVTITLCLWFYRYYTIYRTSMYGLKNYSLLTYQNKLVAIE